MASTWARSRAVERIAALGGQLLDAATLRGNVLDVMADVVGFDAYVWLLTDPVTMVGAAPLAVVPGQALDELAVLVRAKYTTATNRWTALAGASSPVGLADLAEEVDSQVDQAWRELLSRHRIRGVASTVFADQFGCWGFLDLWRDEHRAIFDAQDAQFLAAVAPAVTTALRNCQARTFVEPATPHRHSPGPVVMTLDDDLRITGRTVASQGWLDVLLPPGPGEQSVPASVYNVAAQLLAIEAGIDQHQPSTRTHLRDGFWLTLRAARMPLVQEAGERADPGAAGIVVTIEEASAIDRLDVFSRAFALSARESELVGLLAAGGDTRTMARDMALSEHTVQDHLKSIFAKTGARDRVTVLSRALGTRAMPGR